MLATASAIATVHHHSKHGARASKASASITDRLSSDRASIEVTSLPSGANQIHVYFFDAKTGAQYTKGKELTVTATLPAKEIGPLPLTVQDSGPGHYIVQNALLNAPGEWEIDVVLRISEFEQLEKKIEVGVSGP